MLGSFRRDLFGGIVFVVHTWWCLGTLFIDKDSLSRPPQNVMPLISIKSGSPRSTREAYPLSVLFTSPSAFRQPTLVLLFVVVVLLLMLPKLLLVLGAAVESPAAAGSRRQL